MSPQMLILGVSSRQTGSFLMTLRAEEMISSTSSSLILTSFVVFLSFAFLSLSIIVLRVSVLLCLGRKGRKGREG